jgi:hypothetical protein
MNIAAHQAKRSKLEALRARLDPLRDFVVLVGRRGRMP